MLPKHQFSDNTQSDTAGKHALFQPAVSLRAMKHCEHIQHTKKQIQVQLVQHCSLGRKLEKPEK